MNTKGILSNENNESEKAVCLKFTTFWHPRKGKLQI